METYEIVNQHGERLFTGTYMECKAVINSGDHTIQEVVDFNNESDK